MTSQDKGRPLPKFGEWDVNNPASAEGFTVIFNKARNDKKTNNGNSATEKTSKNTKANDNKVQYPPSQRKWFCCR
ncbi:hypothetical protein MKW98_014897 [Papaver atlanticum]|uniref:RIN4 pathogenic type III effector avirulence factor Avr cleavage site domain-containing protein n=1 Tax=Papaver atlanticum TaxID=357466 RepID=A0AAD4T4Z5_9MAGN|nr:hypothetical protein MKW92_043553 [Papaver armeniacum]KAI3940838.1 hypothetical protein MKW98_014897 [Papaver atlanticum]